MNVQEQLQVEIEEIAEVLSRRSGKPMVEVWNEALSQHRVRYEREVLAEEAKEE
jgi:hypothetical protein